jgi:AAA15 family ATPase/GTPase
MFKLKEINIFQFKGIQKMEYHPKQINLLIGRNNTGKTTLLSAISCLFLKDLSPDSLEAPEYEINLNSNMAQISSGNYSLKMFRDLENIDNNNIKKEIFQVLNMRLKEIFFRQSDKKKSDEKMNNEIINYIFNNFRFLTLIKNDRYIEIFPYSKNYKKTRMEILDPLKKYFPRIDRDKFYRYLYEFSTIEYELPVTNQKNLKRIKVVTIYHDNKLDFSLRENSEHIIEIEKIIKSNHIIEDFERLSEDGVLLKINDKIKFLPYEYYGDGFKSLLTIITGLIQAKNGILLIEEVENHLHPGYINIIVEAIFQLSKEYKVQVFMTTHSFDFIKECLAYAKQMKNDQLLISKFVIDEGKISRYDYSLEQALKVSENFALDLRGV